MIEDKEILIQATMDEYGEEVCTVRVDKYLEELMNEKPTSRWNPDYWHPYYDNLIRTIKKHPTVLLANHRNQITSGFRSGGVKFTKNGYPYLQVRNILDTGIDFINVDLIPHDSPARKKNKKACYGDILINRSGEGSVGRLSVYLSEEESYVGGHVYRFSVKDISPIYVAVFLKTEYGKQQIHRFESGVSGKTEIDLEEILNIEIPLIAQKSIEKIEQEYSKMSIAHEKAMLSRKSNKNFEYDKQIKKAEQILNEIIAFTYSIVEGENKTN
jgi:hypothetical protein